MPPKDQPARRLEADDPRVERFFRDITVNRLRRGVFTSVPELGRAEMIRMTLPASRWQWQTSSIQSALLKPRKTKRSSCSE